jgi:hypothetical protein
MMSMLEHALEYAARGWAVFPAWGITNGACDCGKPHCDRQGKHPIPHNGVDAATTSSDEIEYWWGMYPNANIAIATGEISDLIVLDVDVGDGKPGLENLAILEAKFGALPRSCVARSGGNGRHIYMAAGGKSVRCSAGTVATAIDIRGHRGYIIAPPSRHISGNTYKWESYDA